MDKKLLKFLKSLNVEQSAGYEALFEEKFLNLQKQKNQNPDCPNCGYLNPIRQDGTRAMCQCQDTD